MEYRCIDSFSDAFSVKANGNLNKNMISLKFCTNNANICFKASNKMFLNRKSKCTASYKRLKLKLIRPELKLINNRLLVDKKSSPTKKLFFQRMSVV